MLEVLVAIISLSVASYYDLRYRLIPDEIWVFMGIVGLLLRIFYLDSTISYLGNYLLFLLILIALLLMEWVLSSSGEADLLAFVSLSVLSSWPPGFLPPPFSTYIYSKILMVLVIPLQALINIFRVIKRPELLKGFDEPIWRKLLAIILLSPYSKALSYGASIAETEIDGRRKFLLRAALSPISELEPPEDKWIAPTYPMIPFILLGYLITICVGDPISLFYQLLRLSP